MKHNNNPGNKMMNWVAKVWKCCCCMIYNVVFYCCFPHQSVNKQHKDAPKWNLCFFRIFMFHNEICVPEFAFHNQKLKIVDEVATFILLAQYNHISNFLFLKLLYFYYSSFIHIHFIILSHQILLLICNSKLSQIKHRDYYYYYLNFMW